MEQSENLPSEIKAGQLSAEHALVNQARAEAACHEVTRDLVPARQRIAELMRGLHESEIELHRLRQQARQSGEHAQRIERDLEEIAAQHAALEARRGEAVQRFQTDRKSVVEGKSVYVRVDLGVGRRINKKNNN